MGQLMADGNGKAEMEATYLDLVLFGIFVLVQLQ